MAGQGSEGTKIAILSLSMAWCHIKTDILTYIFLISALAHLSLLCQRP